MLHLSVSAGWIRACVSLPLCYVSEGPGSSGASGSIKWSENITRSCWTDIRGVSGGVQQQQQQRRVRPSCNAFFRSFPNRLRGRILVHSYRKDAVINTICRGQEVRTWEQLPVLLPHDILKPDFLSWWYISDLEQYSDCSVFFLEGRNLCPDSQQRFKRFTFLQPRQTQVLWRLIPPLEAAQPADFGILKLLCGEFFHVTIQIMSKGRPFETISRLWGQHFSRKLEGPPDHKKQGSDAVSESNVVILLAKKRGHK